MSLTVDPFSGLRIFEDAMTRMMNEPRNSRPWSPATDVLETQNELVIKADLPDVDLKDIDIQVENQTLTVKGTPPFRTGVRRATPRSTASSAVTGPLFVALPCRVR